MKHINYVRQGGRINESRILKLWRSQRGLDFPSFLSGTDGYRCPRGAVFRNVVWQRNGRSSDPLRDTFPNARVVDPANTNNIISDDPHGTPEKGKVKTAAELALKSRAREETSRKCNRRGETVCDPRAPECSTDRSRLATAQSFGGCIAHICKEAVRLTR